MRRLRSLGRRTALAATALAAAADAAAAHGFGQRYDLPMPLSFYVFGAGATILVSFVIVAIVLPMPSSSRAYPSVAIGLAGPAPVLCALANVVRASGAAYAVLMVAAGLFGSQSAMQNIVVVSVWVLGWVAVSLVCTFVFDVWRLVDPWGTLADAAAWLWAKAAPGRRSGFGWTYPAALGAWPAVIVFLVFAWMELVWQGREVPARIAHAMLLYSAFTWAGMLAFGREAWRRNADMLAIVFGVFARFAPLVYDSARRRLIVRPPGGGLLDDEPISLPMLCLVVTLLSTVTFDGLLETPLWARLDLAVIDAPDDSVLWTVLGLTEGSAVRLVRSVGLVGFTLAFGATYALVSLAIATVTRRKGGGVSVLAAQFVMSLLPISVAYHVAHYFTYLVNSGQLVVPLASDPFGFGWNLFGTASYKPDIGLATPVMQWYVAIAAIVAGHMLAIYVAHMVALRTFKERRLATISQLPMLMLMVVYTMLSLWILSQPIVETSAAG